MEEKSDSNEKKAEHPGITKVSELVEATQNPQGYDPSPKNSDGHPSAPNPTFTRQSSGDKESDFKINDWLPALDLEQYKPDIEQESGVKDRIKGSTHFAWIGAGHCGTKLAKSFYDLGHRKVLAVDSTQQDLDSLDIPENQKFLIYMRENKHGGNIETCQKAVQQHKQDILNLARPIFGTKVNHIMICFGAGGTTGTACIGELINVAKRYARYIRLENPNKSVGVVMTLPAADRVTSDIVENFYEVASQLGQMATAGKISPLIIIDNDKINRMYTRISQKSFWPRINSAFTGLFDIFNRISALSTQYTSFDSLDYQRIMQAGGCIVMGATKVNKLDDPFAISEAVEDNLHKTLCAGGFDLSTAKEVGCIVVGGRGLMANVKGLQGNIDYTFDILSDITGQATIRRGIYEDNSNSLKVYTIIAGLDTPTARLQKSSADLHYRMKKVNLKGPPLNQRTKDILPLAEYFLAKQADAYREPYKFLSPEAEELLLNYTWPGDITELANAMERAHVLTPNEQIQPAALPFKIIFADFTPPSKRILLVLYQTRRDIITRALDFTKGHQLVAAKILGIEYGRLSRFIKKLNISLTDKNIVAEERPYHKKPTWLR